MKHHIQNNRNQNNKNDLSSVFYRVLLLIQLSFFKFIGLSPWSINFKEIIKKKYGYFKNNSILVISFCHSAYNIFLIILWCSCNVYTAIIIKHNLNAMTVSLLTKAVGVNLAVFGMISPIFAWLVYVLRQKIIINFVNKLKLTDKLLEKYSIHLLDNKNNNNNNKNIRILLFINFVLCCCLFIVLIGSEPLNILPIRYVPSLINSWILMQYSMVLNALNQRFKTINLTILKLGNIDTDIKFQTLFVLRVPLRRSGIRDIENLNHTHAELCKMCEIITNFYGLPILLTIIFFGALSIFILYFIVIFKSDSLDKEEIHRYIVAVTWFMVVIFGFVVMTSYTNRVIEESKKTGKVVHLLLDRCTMDQKLQNELIEFSYQLLHRKVEFTACGIISLDGSLLQAISGTIVTYLIILLQFRGNDHTTSNETQ